ncbi:MAG: vitamin K epoxide reductase family protein [Gammaproteobacteria bacterium]
MAKRKRSAKTRKPAEKIREPADPKPAAARPDWALVAVAVAGIGVTAMLLWSSMGDAALPYCSEGSGCDLVQASPWSRFLGLPLALWGFGAYLLLGLVALGGAEPLRRRRAAFLAAAGFGISVYLAAVSGFAIGAWCAYCLASLVLMGAAFGLSFRPGHRAPRGGGLAFAVLVAAAMHASALGLFGSVAAEDPALRALAEHLSERGMKFYGASWCPHCQQQKALFGAASRHLPYVECSPNGPRAPRATACEVADIRNYPTWVVDGRHIERVLPVQTLATISGYDGPLPE